LFSRRWTDVTTGRKFIKMSIADPSSPTTGKISSLASGGRFRIDDWQRPLPKKVLHAFANGSEKSSWLAWTEYLADRKKPAGLRQLFPGRQSPLLWSMVVSLQAEETIQIAKILSGGKLNKNAGLDEIEARLAEWLTEPSIAVVDSCHALQWVAWAWSLADLAQQLPASHWWELEERLIAAAANACQLDLACQPLSAILLGGELPLVLAHFFPEQKATAELRTLAITNLSESLIELLDGEGMPTAGHLQHLRPLLGCWTRCRAIMEHRSKFLWSDDAEQQYRWLVTQALRMSRPGGEMVFASDHCKLQVRELFRAALELGGNGADLAAADCLLGGQSTEIDKCSKLAPSYNSEWASLAILRNKWSRKSRQLAVSYHDGRNRIELCHGPEVVVGGEASFAITVDGQPVMRDSGAEWEEVAWESDKDVDYLELELDVSGQIRIQRSFLLAHNDQFLLIADALISEKPAQIEYTSSLPLGDGITVDIEQETRELTLKGQGPFARVLPLWLPEWRTAGGNGSLEVQQRSLVLRHAGQSRLFTPLFFDLAPKRVAKLLTWRQLAVAQMRKNLPANEATGFRVQIGRKQWLLYRSLTGLANRTLLGQNLLCELHVSRFLGSGDVEPLIEIQ
jgi:hypothetical protein